MMPTLSLLLQAAPLDEGWWRLVEILGSGIFFSVTTVAVFRSRLTSLSERLTSIGEKVDGNAKAMAAHRKSVDEELVAVETRLIGKIDDIHNVVAKRESTEVVETMRAEGRLRDQFTLMRQDMNDRHAENRTDLRVLRRQQFAVLEILVDTLGSRVSKKQVDAVLKILRAEQDRDMPANVASAGA